MNNSKMLADHILDDQLSLDNAHLYLNRGIRPGLQCKRSCCHKAVGTINPPYENSSGKKFEAHYASSVFFIVAGGDEL
jgi:hypothetical protein